MKKKQCNSFDICAENERDMLFTESMKKQDEF